ncbi:MAG TPA: nitronate monooxygenase, partial [Acidimicrobiales bacterium]|nr:nitronate monooxygenase [Acidimicrobiales bacterium]
EGIQLGPRRVATGESPIPDNGKQAIGAAAETDPVFLNRHASPALRALRTDYSSALEFDTTTNAFAAFGDQPGVYFRGELDKGIALSGEVAGRIDAVRPVAQVIRECADDCVAVLADLAARYPAPTA